MDYKQAWRDYRRIGMGIDHMLRKENWENTKGMQKRDIEFGVE